MENAPRNRKNRVQITTKKSRNARREAQRRRRRRQIFRRLTFFMFFILLMIGLSVAFFYRSRRTMVSNEDGKRKISEQVEGYRGLVEQIAPEYGLEDYTDLILAVMMQESSGVGTDIMSSSESGYNTEYSNEPGSIEDPEYSLRCGLETLRAAFEKMKVRNEQDLDRIALALQGYNFGINGYLDYVEENGITVWTRETAEEYAQMASGNTRRAEDDVFAQTAGPWDYGDQRYPEHVLRYYS